jgi:hypothetical protein
MSESKIEVSDDGEEENSVDTADTSVDDESRNRDIATERLLATRS